MARRSSAQGPARRGWRLWMHRARVTLTLLALGVWLVLFRPAYLGGSAGYVMVAGKSMQPTFHNGDMVIVRRHDRYKIGDVISYRVPEGELAAGIRIIHRIRGIDGARYVTRGDNRRTQDLYHPAARDIDGSRWIHVPGAGRWLMLARRPYVLATFVALMMFFWLGGADVTARRKPDPEPTWFDEQTPQLDDRDA